MARDDDLRRLARRLDRAEGLLREALIRLDRLNQGAEELGPDPTAEAIRRYLKIPTQESSKS